MIRIFSLFFSSARGRVPEGGWCVVYSVTAIASSVRSISLSIESLVALLSAGGGVVVFFGVALTITVFAVGRVIQLMNLVNPLSIGRVGINPLTHVLIRGLILSPAEAT